MAVGYLRFTEHTDKKACEEHVESYDLLKERVGSAMAEGRFGYGRLIKRLLSSAELSILHSRLTCVTIGR
jgi:hypothetical protein